MNPAAMERPLLMGILNVTPDSFSDGGQFRDPEEAVAHGVKMAEEGADLVDIGGESTRPGAARLSAEDQLQRVMPVLESLRRELPATCGISIDSTLSKVARAALDAGATLINDVSAGRDDPAMFGVARERAVPIVLMHMQGTPADMQKDPRYDNVVSEVREFLLSRAAAAEKAGIRREHIVIDPGIGFGKDRQHNLDLIANLDKLAGAGYTLMLGTSRKRFMGSICKVERYSELVAATCATTALGVMAGVKMFRVHDVKANRQALDVAWAIKQAAR